MNLKKPAETVLLLVLDGWGHTKPGPGNVISLAKTPNMDQYWLNFPHTQLRASSESVGLPHGRAGNTETGHINLGAGRIVPQDLARINMSIADGSFFTNPSFIGAIKHAKNNSSNLHLMGLLGEGGVHSNIEHLFALIQLIARYKLKNVFIHLFTDGRDSPPQAAMTYVAQLETIIQKEGTGKIASLMGRYWAMDRDQRWERTAKAYFALTQGRGFLANSPKEIIEHSYAQNITDEFIEPSLIAGTDNKPIALIRDNDAVIFINYRIDRPRQLSRAFILPDLEKTKKEWGFDPYAVKYEEKHAVSTKNIARSVFERGKLLSNLYFSTMTEYGTSLVEAGAKVAYPPEFVNMPLGEVISNNNLSQLRVAESEKERFVSYYFNGQHERPFPHEDRLIVPSPAVDTYDLQPGMSAEKLTQLLIREIVRKSYSFILVNLANPDMLGHTGNIKAAIQGCEVVDKCVGEIVAATLSVNGVVIITSDHGNVEEMINLNTGGMSTDHTLNPVPFILIANELVNNPTAFLPGVLGDVAPTVLKLFGIKQPKEMTGRSLL